jgi:predicted secreted Zn-dependent protease
MAVLLVLLGCVRPVVATAPAPEPIVGAVVDWYTLEGADRVELLESCIRRCPRDDRGNLVSSVTTWRLAWQWTRSSADTCEVAGAVVDADITVRLPEWEPPDEADTGLVEEWHAWSVALRRHEQGHVDVVRSMVHDAEARVTEAGCAGADAAGNGLERAVWRAQQDYDRLTASGHAQGASFWNFQVFD